MHRRRVGLLALLFGDEVGEEGDVKAREIKHLDFFFLFFFSAYTLAWRVERTRQG